MNQKIKTKLGVAIILIAVATAGLFIWNCQKNQPITEIANQVLNLKKNASTNQQETNSDWQTYRNEKYGFEFQYPRKMGTFEEDSEGLPFLFDRKNSNNSSWSDNIQFGKPYTFVSKGTVEENLNWALKEYDCLKDEKIPLVNGEACCYEISRPNPQTGIGNLGPKALIVGKKDVFFIDYNIGKESEISQADKVFRQILSTFKFTK